MLGGLNRAFDHIYMFNEPGATPIRNFFWFFGRTLKAFLQTFIAVHGFAFRKRCRMLRFLGSKQSLPGGEGQVTLKALPVKYR